MASVVVTGGGTGIGLAVAGWFAGRGHTVTIVGRRADVLEKAATEIGANPVVCDLSSPDALAEALPHFPAAIDVLVNNAGGNTDLQRAAAETGAAPTGESTGTAELDGGASLLTRTARAWWANLEANVLTAVLTTTALEDRLNDNGRVITIGSIAARTGATSYGAAKAALEAWNISLAGELGPRGITANVVSPGLTVDTEFFVGQLSRERYDWLVANTRTGRPGTPEDIAAVVGFLASPEARHVTAQVVHVDGGAYPGH